MNEKGFALPVTLFMVTILTVMLAATFTRTNTESLIANSNEAGVDALAVAQSGLQSYFGENIANRPVTGDSIRYNVAGGYAWVSPTVIQTPVDPSADYKYIIRSTGYVIHPNQGATPMAVRTIAQFADWQSGEATELAAITPANGIRRRNDGNIRIEGNDVVCNPLTGESVPHTRRPNEGVTYWLDTSSGGINQADNGPTVAGQTNVDWATLNGLLYEADYTSFRAWDISYPSMVIDGNYTMSNTGGYGILIVTGNLTTSGWFNIWRGIVLVGGRIRFNSRNDFFYGMVASGLDEQLGSNPQRTEVGGKQFGSDRNTNIFYAPCEIDNALGSVKGFVPLANTWVDNWAAY